MLGALLLATGCGGRSQAAPPVAGSPPPTAATAPGSAAGAPGATLPDPAAPDPAAPAPVPAGTAGELRLEVTGFHLFPVPAGDQAAQRAAADFVVPVSEVTQMHLLLIVRNQGATEHGVASDVLRLGLGARTVDAATADVFPAEPLRPGEQVETAAGFDVATRAGPGPVTLQWTHEGATTVVPIGSARQAG